LENRWKDILFLFRGNQSKLPVVVQLSCVGGSDILV
jgi:hypothetical protein